MKPLNQIRALSVLPRLLQEDLHIGGCLLLDEKESIKGRIYASDRSWLEQKGLLKIAEHSPWYGFKYHLTEEGTTMAILVRDTLQTFNNPFIPDKFRMAEIKHKFRMAEIKHLISRRD